MKKQLFLLTILLIAYSSISWGQALKDSDPRGSLCKDDALHPVPGKSYDYSVTVDPTGGDFRWWATKNDEFILNYGINAADSLKEQPSQITAASDNYGKLGTSATVSLTWSSEILASTVYQSNPTFVAVHYVAPASGCADNLKVYELNPINAFTVDIKNIDEETKNILTYDTDDAQCVDDVSSAIYSGGAMQYLYGTDTLFYEVIAANFTGSYTPLFNLTGLNGVQTSVIQWTYDKPSLWNSSTTWNAAATPVTTTINTDKGVSIYVRVIITNNNFENLAGQTVVLAVDGSITVGATTIWDINNGAGDACTPTTAADQLDIAEQVINPRPEILENVDTTPTAPAAPQNLIPGNEVN